MPSLAPLDAYPPTSQWAITCNDGQTASKTGPSPSIIIAKTGGDFRPPVTGTLK